MMTLPTVPRQKVDERTTAAALGYVAMVVSILGNLSSTRKEGGLCYPVTCAGSRSLVKDTVSVMQGPRSYVPLHLLHAVSPVRTCELEADRGVQFPIVCKRRRAVSVRIRRLSPQQEYRDGAYRATHRDSHEG